MAAISSTAEAKDYYVSALGSDSSSGASAAAPWKTLNRVNGVDLQPGDRVFLRGGDTFPGKLYLDQADRGLPGSKIQITSYGSGLATISAGTDYGIYAYNTAGVRISRLRVLGSGWQTSQNSGIFFYMDLPQTKLDGIEIWRVDCAGFRSGIEIGAWNGTSGYKNVLIQDVTARHNRENGITVWGYDAPGHVGHAHQNVRIVRARAYANSGTEKTGSGIVMSNVDGGVIERSVAHSNGIRLQYVPAAGGPVGIWAWRANGIVIQNNESYNNRSTAGGADGGGFDLDGGVTNSVMQYNYSHGNDGAGYLLAQYKDALPFGGNTVRYNISENDGMKNGYGGITVWSYAPYGIQNTEIYNNTVYLSAPLLSNRSGVAVWSKTVNVSFRNNIIVTRRGARLMYVAAGQTNIVFQNNAYWTSGYPFDILWGSTLYKSLAAFRATGQERLGGGVVGYNVDPQLASPGAGVTFNNASKLESLAGYKLRATSPLINKAFDLTARFGINVGPRDYFGAALPLGGAAYDLGAHEGTGG